MPIKPGERGGRATFVAACLGVYLVARAVEPAATPAVSQDWTALREQTFSTVWETVNESYYDAAFGGVDWTAMRDKYRVLLPEVTDQAALRRLLEKMLAELKRSHFAIMPRETAVFTPEERVRIGTTGARVAFVENVVAVSDVAADSAAARAGLRPGDAILEIDGLAFETLDRFLRESGVEPARSGLWLAQLAESRLRSAVGSAIKLTIRKVDGQRVERTVVCEAHEGAWSEPVGNFPSVPVECSIRQLEPGVACLRFNVFARQVMKEIRKLLVSMPADGGLIIDLRGNPGGITVMAPGITGWLSDREFSLGTMHLRKGHFGFEVAPQAGAFLGPVALLIDRGSASTSEIMAAGLQEAGRVRVFGENSPGAALPSLFKTLPTGDLLQYAVADMQTPAGKLIEGRGVIPDEPVNLSLADLAAGRDPVVEAARQWLEGQRRKVTSTLNPP
jgi:carboxyl-terminal processing protease